MTRDGCNYLSAPGRICNKCGHDHAAVPAQPVAWTHVDYLTAAEHARQNDYPFAISAQARGPTPTHDVPLYAAPQAVPVPAVPVASVTECEACFTPDACQLRGKCDHYAAEQLRVAKRPDQLVQWGDWTLVPVDPTEAMLKAGLDECEPLGSLIDWDEGFGRDEMRDTYAAMLAAAPKEQPHE